MDARRNVLGLFMPTALFLIFVMLALPQVQLYISPAMLVLMAVMAIDGFLLARKVNRAVDEKFPENAESHWKLGLYAAGRASQIRRCGRRDQWSSAAPRSRSAARVRTLVLGGIRSGKSRWAEELISAEPVVRYIATGRPDSSDQAWSRRIAAHRKRRPDHWATVESAHVAGELRSVPDTPTLVDDIGGWLVAALDRRGWQDESTSADVDELLCAVADFTAPLVLISPEVGMALVPASESGRRFADGWGRRISGWRSTAIGLSWWWPDCRFWLKQPMNTEAPTCRS